MANENRVRGDLVSGTLSVALSNVDTTMSSAALANLPAVSASQHAVIVCENEKIYVTAHTASATTATILRGQEGSAAASHSINTAWVHGPVVSDYDSVLGYTQVTSASGTIGTSQPAATTLITAPAVTVPYAQHRVRITAQCWFQSTVAGDTAVPQIMEGATMLNQGQIYCAIANQAFSIVIHAIVVPTAASHTYSVNAWRNQGSGNVTMYAAANVPAFILVEDLGPAL